MISDPNHSEQHRTETVLTVLAALATLAFAWSGFQGGQWVRERFLDSDQSASLANQAFDLSAEADRLEEGDTILYLEWLGARHAENDQIASIVFKLFRPEVSTYLKTATLDPAGFPIVAPFDAPKYDAREMRDQAALLSSQSAALGSSSDGASQNGALYAGLGVMFAAVLAAVGIANRISDSRLQKGLTWVAGLLFLSAFIYLLFSPILLFGG